MTPPQKLIFTSFCWNSFLQWSLWMPRGESWFDFQLSFWVPFKIPWIIGPKVQYRLGDFSADVNAKAQHSSYHLCAYESSLHSLCTHHRSKIRRHEQSTTWIVHAMNSAFTLSRSVLVVWRGSSMSAVDEPIRSPNAPTESMRLTQTITEYLSRY